MQLKWEEMILWDVRVYSSLFLKGSNFFVHFSSFFANKKQKILNGSLNFAKRNKKNWKLSLILTQF